MAYEKYETDLFRDQLRKFRKSDRATAERIEAAIRRLVRYPHTHDGPLKGPFSGHLKKYVGKNKHRIIFKYCAHCLQTRKTKCDDCELPDNAVIFHMVFLRGEGYD